MSTGDLKSIVNLRVYCNNWRDGMGAYPSDVEKYADEIEQEIAERYIELPVDADGVPWHIGDEVRRTINKDLPSIVMGVYLYEDGRHKLYVPETACTAWSPYASKYRHVKPRTIEDVLEEYGSQVFGITTEEHDELIAKYADEIRGMMA